MGFIIGCNYWASNAGIEMWKEFDLQVIENDLKLIFEHGVKYMRVFPLWRDFQPIKPNYTQCGDLLEYAMESGELPRNEYFLDEEMLDRFSKFLDVCNKYNVKVIVGLITGWMSAGLFIPTALYGKNVLTDSFALYLEQLFIKGFIEKFKCRNEIYAWDLGNECNCAGNVKDRFEAANWTATISNAIRSADPTRLIVSGMHSLSLEDEWRIQDQAQFTDILTTHPYPRWCRHTTIDETLSFRTTMHATAESKWYADIGGKPCLAEEIGTMGPTICGDDNSADFMRLNMFSLWANGANGAMWWCAHEQNKLHSFPYSVSMIERELGLLNAELEPKPVLKEMKKFADFMEKIDFNLPKAAEHGVCLLSKDQDQWGIAYMTYALAKKVGLNLKFSYVFEQELPDSKLYLLPSIQGNMILHKKTFEELKKKVYDGADLYISIGQSAIEGFENLTGLKVIDSYIDSKSDIVSINSETVSFTKTQVRHMIPTTANVLVKDSDGNPFISVNQYGKGRVFVVDAPIESNMLSIHNAFEMNFDKIYQMIFKDHIDALPIKICAENVVFTYHSSQDAAYLVAINHSGIEKDLNLNLKDNYIIDKVFYGDSNIIKPFDACVIRLQKI